VLDVFVVLVAHVFQQFAGWLIKEWQVDCPLRYQAQPDMTLNLILTSKDAVYLSGDFRLTSIKEQAALPDSYDTQKLIPVIRQGWAALIAYMGVASAPPLIEDMGQWIVEEMDSIPLDGGFSEVSRRLLKLNAWLGRIQGDRRIAVSIVGFWDQRPCMMLLSNFLDLHWRVTEAGPQLKTYLRRSNQPEVHSVGTARPDVFERVRLERLLQASASRGLVPELIREAAAGINAAVGRRSQGSISEECVTGYLLRSGSSTIGAHGITEHAACFPNWVRRDLQKGGVIGFEPVEDQARRVFPAQWKLTTTAIVNGKIVHVHEIANTGKPILIGIQRLASKHHLSYFRQHTRVMTRKRQRRLSPDEQQRFVVLRGTVDDAIRVVKYTG